MSTADRHHHHRHHRHHSPSAHKRKAEPAVSPKRKKARTNDSGSSSGSEFRTVGASVVLAIPPVFAADCRAGAEEMLDSMIMRYQPALDGVVLAHADLQFLDHVGQIKAESPFATLNVGFNATVWRPEIGMRLKGHVSLCSPDHISLLVHRTFNVSIPRHHIPADQWEFEYGAAENDPEFGAGAEAEGEAGEGEESADRGRWIHRVTAEPVGGRHGRLEFTVVGFTIANEMLSLIGSLQPDPLSPEHVPQPASRPRALTPTEDDIDIDLDLEAAGEESDEIQEVDVVAAKAEQEKREKKEKKRKRKSEVEGEKTKGTKRKKAS